MLVEDHELFRTGLRSLLHHDGIPVVGEAADGEAAVDVIESHEPDVVVMDIGLPGRSGIAAAREARRRSPGSRILMLSISEREEDIVAALAAGACGYLLKDSAVEEITDAIRSAARGEATLSQRIAARLLAHLRAGQTEQGPAPELVRPNERELELLELLASSGDKRAAAERLGVTPEAVGEQLAEALRRLMPPAD